MFLFYVSSFMFLLFVTLSAYWLFCNPSRQTNAEYQLKRGVVWVTLLSNDLHSQPVASGSHPVIARIAKVVGSRAD